MAYNNGRVSHRIMGGSRPSFLIVALCIVLIILLYSYWSLSSRNSLLLRDVTVLQSRLRTLTGNKMKIENRNKKLMTDLTRIHGDSTSLKEIIENQKKTKAAVDKQVARLQQELTVKQKSLEKMQRVEVQYKKELLGFKESINNTSGKFKRLNEGASKVLKLYNELKQKNSELQKKVKLLESQVEKYKNAYKKVLTREGGRNSKLLGRPNLGRKDGHTTVAADLTQPGDSQVVTRSTSKLHQRIKDDENEDGAGEDGEEKKTVEIVKPTGNNTNDNNQTTEAGGNDIKISGNHTVTSHSNATIESTRKSSNVSSSNGSLKPTLLTAVPSSDISEDNEQDNGAFVNNLKGKLGNAQLRRPPIPRQQPGSRGRQSEAQDNQIRGPGRFGELPKDKLQNLVTRNVDKMHRPRSDQDHEAEEEDDQ